MEREEENIVMSFLSEGNNIEMVRRIVENYPNLDSPKWNDKFESIVAELLSEISPRDDLVLDVYSDCSRNYLDSEINVAIFLWKHVGLPFQFRLYSHKKSGVRVMLSYYEKKRKENEDSLRDFSQKSNGIIGEYPSLPGWSHWHSVFADDGNRDEIEETLIDSKVFDESFWEQVKDRLRVQLKVLVPLVDNWLDENYDPDSPPRFGPAKESYEWWNRIGTR